MKKINDFLERFKKISIPDESVRLKVVEILSVQFNEEIKLEDISVKNGVVYIKTEDPSFKSDIFLRKRKILEDLNSHLGKITIKDIR